MSLRPDVGGSGEDFSHPHEAVVLEPYEDGTADLSEAYELDLWDQMSDDMMRWNRDFSFDQRRPVANNGPLQMLAVAYGEKSGHDLGDGLGSTEAVEEAIDYARDLGLTVVYRWEGIDEELVEDGHEIYVTDDPELAELAAEQEFSFYEDDEVYGQLMGFPEEDIEAYEDWRDIGDGYENDPEKSMNENLDAKKEYVRSQGGEDSVISHRGVVREIVRGNDYDFRDFVGAFGAVGYRVVDSEERIDEVVQSVRTLDRNLKEDAGTGIVELEAGPKERDVFQDHRTHFRDKRGKSTGLKGVIERLIRN